MLLSAAASASAIVGKCRASPIAVTAPPCLVHSRTRVSRAGRQGRARAASAVGSPVTSPVVKIDNVSDPFATVLTVEFGSADGTETPALLDAVTALKNLGLNIKKAKLASATANTFFITDATTSEKVVRSARLEDIRMTIINNLMAKYPEASGAFNRGGAMSDGEGKPLGARRVVQTTIDVSESNNGSCSVLKIATVDRPGLLVDIVRVLKDINLNVVSAEIETVGTMAQDEFFVTYHGEPLSSPMVLLVTNALQYYLSLSEVAKEESY